MSEKWLCSSYVDVTSQSNLLVPAGFQVAISSKQSYFATSSNYDCSDVGSPKLWANWLQIDVRFFWYFLVISSTNIQMEKWKLSNRPLRNKHLSCSTQRSLIRVWSHKKCWFCTSQTGMQAGLGLQGHIARNWSQRQGLYISRFFFWLVAAWLNQGLYISRTWLLLVNDLAPRTTMENRMQISKIRRKYRCIHTHAHTRQHFVHLFLNVARNLKHSHIEHVGI